MLPKLSPLPIHPPHCGWGETAGVADGAARELLRFAQQKHATEEVAGFLAHHPTALGVVQVRTPLPLTLYRAGGGGGLPGAPPHGALGGGVGAAGVPAHPYCIVRTLLKPPHGALGGGAGAAGVPAHPRGLGGHAAPRAAGPVDPHPLQPRAAAAAPQPAHARAPHAQLHPAGESTEGKHFGFPTPTLANNGSRLRMSSSLLATPVTLASLSLLCRLSRTPSTSIVCVLVHAQLHPPCVSFDCSLSLLGRLSLAPSTSIVCVLVRAQLPPSCSLPSRVC